MKAELEHIHEHLDQVENTRAGQPQIVPQARQRERASAGGEIDDYYKDEYDEGEDSVGRYKRDGWGRRARNRDDGLSDIKIKIHLFKVNSIWKHTFNERRKWSSCLIATAIQR